MKLNIRLKLILIFIVIFTIPMVISQIVFARYAKNFAKDSTTTLNIQNIHSIGISCDQTFNSLYDFGLYATFETNITGFLTTPLDSPDFNQKKINVQNTLALLPYSNENIEGIAVWGKDGQYVRSGERIYLSEDEIDTLNQNKGYPLWNFESDSNGNTQIYFGRLLRIPTNLKAEIGYLKIRMNIKALDTLFPQKEPIDTNYYIMDRHGNLIYQNGDTVQKATDVLNTMTADLLDTYNGSCLYLKDYDCYITPYSLSNAGWYLFGISSNGFENSVLNSLNATWGIFTLCCTAICLFLSYAFTALIVSPLKKLGNSMERITTTEDFSTRAEVTGHDEIATLALQFNEMCEKLQISYNEVYLKNIKLKDAQLSILQSQINPHFLYNTLDTIYWMSEFNMTKDVSQMVSSLSKLFRLSLAGDENDMVPLSSELEHVSCYLYIQQVRHQEQLKYEIDTQVEASDYMVIKLILQPLVENAILHGIDVTGSGTVKIHIFCSDDCLIYEVRNTGTDVNIDSIQEILNKPISAEKGIGIRNINDRIRLRHGNSYGINCTVEFGETIFKVTMPVIRKEEVPYDNTDDC